VFTLGAGMFVGSWLSGVVAQNYTNAQNVHDWKAIWLVPALMSAVLIPVFLALFREKPSEDTNA
ncbi:MAG: MFS transporter, partial [Verrucomicrobiae bacterium]|nr:MFS transporter [Verrucomicrobiae bacterium]